ncbi:MAG: hypothetical protein K6C40_10175 [Thermoguttaceae bacterium]|nr:hypothetical protein [Thermoguttaceae bacterium]
MSNITPITNANPTVKGNWSRHFLVLLGIIAALLIGFFVRNWVITPSIPPQVQIHLDVAEQKSIDAATKAEEELHEFFDAAKQNSRRFAEHALGWGSKWRAVSDMMPFTRDDRLKEYITKRFHEDIFSPSDLENVLQDILALYLKDVESIENEMLVNIQQDVPDLPSSSIMRTTPPESLNSIFQTMLVQTAKSTHSDVARCVGREAVSFIAGEILGELAVQMAASAGILTAGGSSAAMTFGIGLIAAVIVDQVVTWIWDWYADPKGEVADAICAQIDNMERLIIQGDGKTPGFREQLLKINQERTEIRKKTIEKMIHSNGSMP